MTAKTHFSRWCFAFPVLFAASQCFGQTTTSDRTATSLIANSSGTKAGTDTTTSGTRHGVPNRNHERKWSRDELEHVSNDVFKSMETAKRSCGKDEFYQYEWNSCEPCQKYCPSKDKLEECGFECRVYFGDLDLERQNNATAIANKYLTIAGVVVVGSLAVCVFLLIFMIFKARSLSRRLEMLDMMQLRGRPKGDVDGDLQDSTQELIPHQETGEDQSSVNVNDV